MSPSATAVTATTSRRAGTPTDHLANAKVAPPTQIRPGVSA